MQMEKSLPRKPYYGRGARGARGASFSHNLCVCAAKKRKSYLHRAVAKEIAHQWLPR